MDREGHGDSEREIYAFSWCSEWMNRLVVEDFWLKTSEEGLVAE